MIIELAVVTAQSAVILAVVVLALRLGRPHPVGRDDLMAIADATRERRPCPDCVWWAGNPDHPDFPVPVWQPCVAHDPEPPSDDFDAWEREYAQQQRRQR